MTVLPPETTSDTLTGLLHTWARGDYATEAAINLLAAHGTWLARDDFRQFITYYPSGDASIDEFAVPDLAAAVRNMAPCSTSEASILRIASSIVDTIVHINVRDALSGLDHRNTQRVLDAVAHAIGNPQRAVDPAEHRALSNTLNTCTDEAAS